MRILQASQQLIMPLLATLLLAIFICNGYIYFEFLHIFIIQKIILKIIQVIGTL